MTGMMFTMPPSHGWLMGWSPIGAPRVLYNYISTEIEDKGATDEISFPHDRNRILGKDRTTGIYPTTIWCEQVKKRNNQAELTCNPMLAFSIGKKQMLIYVGLVWFVLIFLGTPKTQRSGRHRFPGTWLKIQWKPSGWQETDLTRPYPPVSSSMASWEICELAMEVYR